MALGGVAEKVCMLPDSPASVTETFVQSLPGEVAGAATSWRYPSSRKSISIHLLFFFPTKTVVAVFRLTAVCIIT